jgi:hypothetical protein
MLIHVDLDPGQTLPSLKIEILHEKYTYFMEEIGHKTYLQYVP